MKQANYRNRTGRIEAHATTRSWVVLCENQKKIIIESIGQEITGWTKKRKKEINTNQNKSEAKSCRSLGTNKVCCIYFLTSCCISRVCFDCLLLSPSPLPFDTISQCSLLFDSLELDFLASFVRHFFLAFRIPVGLELCNFSCNRHIYPQLMYRKHSVYQVKNAIFRWNQFTQKCFLFAFCGWCRLSSITSRFTSNIGGHPVITQSIPISIPATL